MTNMNTDTQINIRWAYGINGKLPELRENETKCEVTYSPTPDSECKIVTGIAYKVASDPFAKFLGRKHSLARALKTGSFTREERSAIWSHYFAKHPKDKRNLKHTVHQPDPSRSKISKMSAR